MTAARTSRAGAFLAPKDAGALPAPLLRCATPQHALIDLLTLFHPARRPAAGVDPMAVVAPDALAPSHRLRRGARVIEIGRRDRASSVQLHPLVYVGAGRRDRRRLGALPARVLRDGVRLGRRVIVQPGAVIGGDGFGYAPTPRRRHRKIPQVGIVVIEDDVEIGANTTIDRATWARPRVGRGTKIDNLVQVGHNVRDRASTRSSWPRSASRARAGSAAA